MTEAQRKALQAAEDAFRRYADHHAMKGDETKARANMALAGQMAAALSEPEPAYEPFAYLPVNLPDVFAHNAGCTLWAGNPQNKTLSADNSMIAVYTRPQRREPLKDERIHNLDPLPHVMFDAHRIEFARAIEAAHGIGANP